MDALVPRSTVERSRSFAVAFRATRCFTSASVVLAFEGSASRWFGSESPVFDSQRRFGTHLTQSTDIDTGPDTRRGRKYCGWRIKFRLSTFELKYGVLKTSYFLKLNY